MANENDNGSDADGKGAIIARLARLKHLTSSLAHLLEALEDVSDDAKAGGFGAANFLMKEIEESIECVENDVRMAGGQWLSRKRKTID